MNFSIRKFSLFVLLLATIGGVTLQFSAFDSSTDARTMLADSSPSLNDSDSASSDSDGSESRNLLQQSLQAHYRFDSPEVSRGSSLEFDGSDDYVGLGDPSKFNEITDEFSVSVWFKTSSTDDQVILNNANYNENEGWQVRTDSRDRIQFEYYDTSNGNTQPDSNAADLTDGKWHHFVVTFDANNEFVYYVDGSYDLDGGANKIVDNDNSVNTKIGAMDISGYDRRFHEAIDDVRVYNRSLSESEVEDLYQEKPVSSEGLVLHQGFDEGPDGCDLTSGSACLEDKSGNGNDGTPENFDDNQFDTGSGWFNQTPLNRPSLLDSSENSNEGRFYGGNDANLFNFDFNQSSGWLKDPEKARVLKFDGNDDRFETKSGLDLASSDGSSFSLSVWIKTDSNGDIVGKSRDAWVEGSTDSNILLRIVDGTPAWQLEFDGSNDEDTLGGSEDVVDGNWHHVVGVRDNWTFKTYVDGQVDSEYQREDYYSDDGYREYNTALNPESELDIGHYRGSASFEGLIDSVSVYNTSLTSSEIESLYSGESVRDGLVGEWRFEEGNRGTVYDTSGLNREGVLGTNAVGFSEGSSVVGDRFDLSEGFTFSSWILGSSVNIVGNPGFEEDAIGEPDPTGWSYPDEDGWNVTDSYTAPDSEGSKSFGSPWPDQPGVWPDAYIYQNISVDRAFSFKFSAWIRSGALSDANWDGPREDQQYIYEDDARVHLYFYDEEGNLLGENKTRWFGDAYNRGLDYVDREGSWFHVKRSVKPPRGTRTVRFQVDGGDNNNNYGDPETTHGGNAGIWVDDVRLTTDSVIEMPGIIGIQTFDGVIEAQLEDTRMKSEGGSSKFWEHLALSFDGDKAVLYRDGEPVRETEGVDFQGYDNIYLGENFEGSIDEFRIYNRSLSNTEIQRLRFRQ